MNSRYAYTESQIRNSIIPDQEDLHQPSLTPGTSGYRDAVSQLGVWVQTWR